MFKLDFTGQSALVTGASRGIGRAIAAELAALGCRVYGTATSRQGADAIGAELAGQGEGLVLNALDNASVDALAAAVLEKNGAVPDILVNNAGITRDGLFMRMKDQDLNDVLQCDLLAAIRLCRAFVPLMLKKRSGRIINISSIVGETGNAGQCNYAAAKAGLIGFTRSLAKEIAARGVTANCVCPGFVATEMTSALSGEQLKSWLASIPARRAAEPQDIAGAVVFLASGLAGYVTGTCLDVNGGMYCG